MLFIFRPERASNLLRQIILLCFLFVVTQPAQSAFCATRTGIQIDHATKKVTIGVPDESLALVIDYSSGCVVRQLKIKGENTLSPLGIYSGVEIGKNTFSSGDTSSKVTAIEMPGGVTLSGIRYGDGLLTVSEIWTFRLVGNKITWAIRREYSDGAELNDLAFPKWNFQDLNIWKGGILNNGGMVWCKYLAHVNDTYGVHTGGVTFWNAGSGNALAIRVRGEDGDAVAAKYSHGPGGEFVFTSLLTDTLLRQRYNLSRFVSGKTDVFSPVKIKRGVKTMHLELAYENYFQTYSPGSLPGIDAAAVRELLNTTARYGVVDNGIVGANGWLTNWKCLHEPFFAQIGLALGDKNYTRNMSATLDRERDLAMQADGRVLSRWHNAAGDEIPGTYNPETGYYEAMWGYTVDSQTGYIINTSEEFDLNGDLSWLRSHKKSCENALAWLLKRDSDNNGLYEMVNNTIAEKKASDWLDIVYAGYENAFVNAQVYEALTLWAKCEEVLGDPQKMRNYQHIAERLKNSFNKPVQEGGFWLPEKRQYIYWRDKDGSLHGDNLVTPVNFAAIAFGLCDDPKRISLILDQIEKRMLAEKLFHWPLCFDSFKREEVQAGNWPFPKYENGDIFPTWGYLAIRAYIRYDKTIAIKYIKKILEQYNKDGLSSQRYSRVTQKGLGDDILSGISTSITALYRDVYGIRPKWNRMGLDPHLVQSLNGTALSYTLRDTTYAIQLREGKYVMSSPDFVIRSRESFGASKQADRLTYFHQNTDRASLIVEASAGKSIDLEVGSWTKKERRWTNRTAGSFTYLLGGLVPDAPYTLSVNAETRTVRTDQHGQLVINKNARVPVQIIVREKGSG
ncbi:MAG: hypothetical protein INR69_18385 [Mucilaginibacter polytrichastri]|nr:hypothetical protein [Mucilaginibacter polytrichastri]